MKRVVNVGIGGKGFVMDNDAYSKLDCYLEQFRSKVSMGADQTTDLMDDLEARIAEFFLESLGSDKDVVDVNLVDMVICKLGMPDGSQFIYNNDWFIVGTKACETTHTPGKLCVHDRHRMERFIHSAHAPAGLRSQY